MKTRIWMAENADFLKAQKGEPIHKILVLIAYVQSPPANAHSDISRRVRGLIYHIADLYIYTVQSLNNTPWGTKKKL